MTGDTLVMLADGRRLPIQDLVGTKPQVLALSENRTVHEAASDLVWYVGTRPVFRIALASGRSVRATAEHRFLGGSGWVHVGELAPGERLALARTIPEPRQPLVWPDEHVVLLGHMVGDGSYLAHQPLRYTTGSDENSDAVRRAAQTFGVKVNRHEGRGNWHQLVFFGNGVASQRPSGLKARAKIIPPWPSSGLPPN